MKNKFFLIALLVVGMFIVISCPQANNTIENGGNGNSGGNGNNGGNENTVIDLSSATDDKFTKDYFYNYIGLKDWVDPDYELDRKPGRKVFYNDTHKTGFSLGSNLSKFPYEYLDYEIGSENVEAYYNSPFITADGGFLSTRLPILISGVDRVVFEKALFNGKNHIKVSVYFETENQDKDDRFDEPVFTPITTERLNRSDTLIHNNDSSLQTIDDNLQVTYSFWKYPYWEETKELIINPVEGYYFYISDYDKNYINIVSSNIYKIGKYTIGDYISSTYEYNIHQAIIDHFEPFEGTPWEEDYIPNYDVKYLNWNNWKY